MSVKIVTLGAVLALVFTTLGTARGASINCEITGKPRPQCCATKASPMPPCCMTGCATAGQILR